MSRWWAFVPARKNSRRLPGKNRRILNDRPLFRHALDAAVDAGCFERIFLSTDDEEIQELAADLDGIEVLDRPRELATNTVRAKDVVLYHLEQLAWGCDVAALLMPTTPFRRPEHVREAMALLADQDADSVVSLVKYAFHPALALRMEGRSVRPWDRTAPYNWVPESDFAPAYHPNGAIYAATRKTLERTRTFISEDAVGYVMDEFSSLDIDTPADFAFAEFLLHEGLV